MIDGHCVGVVKVSSHMPHAFGNAHLVIAQLMVGPILYGLRSAAFVDERRAHAALARRFEATFDQAAVGIAHVGLDGRFLLVNDRFCQIAGHERDALMMRGFQGITHPEDLDADLANLHALLGGEISSYAMEKRYIRADGAQVWINLTVSLVRDDLGRPEFFVSVIEDISPRKAAEADALHDTLTGLPNRRAMHRKMAAAVERHAVMGQPLCLAFIDLDGFKGVNDRFGHAEGDRCLIGVADALRAGLRQGDMIGRLSGDEFIAMLPDTSAEEAQGVLEALRQRIERSGRNYPAGFSASIGAVVAPPGARASVDDLLSAADAQMYRAKGGGREKLFISVYSPPIH
jgi:diguanylate cyclase (GGDEF)-like protein/PAS domain S-box-containing protein